MTNYEWLLNMGGEERQAWFDAEHVDANDVLTRKGDVRADGVCANDVDVSQDSREKLEADIRKKCELSSEWVNFVTVNEAFGWLDRQAAITERELCKKCDWPSLAAQPDWESQERIAELAAERDNLARDLAECDENRIEFRDQRDHAEEMLAQMERERDYWKLHADCWTDKYKDMRTSRDCFKERAKRNEDKAKNYQRQLSKAERYGTIWPRYGDGAPIEVGDEAVGHYGKSEVTSVRFHGNDVFVGFKWAGMPDAFITDAKRVGRPPLIASDGKPILKGETLYGLSDSKAWTVTGFDRTRTWSVWAENGGGCKCLKPEWLAHEKPADGARAEKIAALEAENAELREKLGEAIGHAHEIGKLVDLEGGRSDG